MKFKGYNINLSLLLVTLAVLAGMAIWVQSHMRLSSDILKSVPSDDAVLSDAKTIFDSFKLPDKVAVDLSISEDATPDKDALSSAADYLQAEMKASGLFADSENNDPGVLISDIMSNISDNPGVFFSSSELNSRILPVLSTENIRKSLENNIEMLGGFEGIGQSDMIAKDPLGLRFIVIERLGNFSDIKDSSIYKGHIISNDSRHALVMAHTKDQGMDTKSARKIESLFDNVSQKLFSDANGDFRKAVKINPIGSYRAALDNERTAKRDIIFAAVFSMLGITLILVTCFPRPYIGMLALLPGLAGTTAAMFVLSIIRPEMSLLALGFGGAILSFTIDSGISFFLFLDRTSGTTGKETSHEIYSVELMAMLTTAGAFTALVFSGFEIMADVGMFAALGAIFTFIFVHTVQPRIFCDIPPAKKTSILPVERIAEIISLKPGWTGFSVAVLFVLIMAFMASPVFNADLNRMNAVSLSTLDAENTFKRVWGDVFRRIYFMNRGSSQDEVRVASDRMAMLFERYKADQMLSSSFTVSDILPSNLLIERNISDWRAFWDEKRIKTLKEDFNTASGEYSFTTDAFDPFFDSISSPKIMATEIPSGNLDFIGLINKGSTASKHILISSAMPGIQYDALKLFNEFHELKLGSMLDYGLFTKSLSEFVHGIFFRTLVTVGGALMIVLLLYYLDITLAILTILPVIFSIICTFGTFRLTGHPVDIPGLMLAVVVLGIGIVFSVYIVRMQQRYINEDHPSMKTIRASVLMAAAVILSGFSVMAFAKHPLLSSAGVSTTLGIFYTYIGTSLLLPPLLRHIFKKQAFASSINITPGSAEHVKLVMSRFKHLEVYARMFARFKMKFDPMFPKLAEFVTRGGVILDAGCGYGIQGVWLKFLHPDSMVYGIDPDSERIRIAGRVLSDGDRVFVSTIQDFAEYPESIDHALMLDMMHYINDEALRLTFKRIKAALEETGRLVIRVTIPSTKKFPWERWLEIQRNRIAGNKIWIRSSDEIGRLLEECGFRIIINEPAARSREEIWFVAVHKEAGRLSR